MSILHRIEDYGDNHIEGPYISLSFDTEYRGIWQCRFTATGIGQFPSQHPFESLKASEQEAVMDIGRAVWYLTFGEIPKF